MTDLVLVPGLLCTAALFEPQAMALEKSAQILIADHTRHDTMEAIAASILENAPGRFVLGGLSMGGYVAFEILRQAPERVRGLVLMDTNARADREAQREDRRRSIDVARTKGLGPVLDAFLPLLVHSCRLEDVDLVTVIREMGQDTGVEAYARQQEAIASRPDNRSFLSEITCPTLVVVGAQDGITPVKVAREMADGMRSARLEIIPECGHLPTLERPGQTSLLLRDFLTEV